MFQFKNLKTEIPPLCNSLITKKTNRKELSAINTITQDMWYRLSLICYAPKYGVTKATVKYKTNL